MSAPRSVPWLAVFVALGFSAAGPPAASAACVTPSASVVVTSSEQAVVTVERHQTGRDVDQASTSTWRGCLQAVGQQLEIERGSSSFSTLRSAEAFRLAGPFAAYRLLDGGKSGSSTSVLLLDLRDGGRFSTPVIDTNDSSRFDYTSHAVNPAGDLAWIRLGVSAGRRRWTVFARVDGVTRELARSRRALSRVRLSPTRATWHQAGRKTVRRAALR